MAKNPLVARRLAVAVLIVAATAGASSHASASPPLSTDYLVTSVTTGQLHTCALAVNGTVACWGANSYGQLGTGNATAVNAPVLITGGALAGKTVVDISAGKFHTCAVASDGTIACWGSNTYGQLGVGSSPGSSLPVAITSGALAEKTVVRISAGGFHTCAVATDGTTACWGSNFYGELGTGDVTAMNTPTEVVLPPLSGESIVDVASGGYHTCAVASDGHLYCWGNNNYGQLGDETNSQSTTAVAVTGGALSGNPVIQVSASETHTCAVLLNGGVACWGGNYYGQLGNGTYDNSNSPVAVTGGALSGNRATHVSAGVYQSCASVVVGTIACWGGNYYGQLGNGTFTDTSVPVTATGGALTGLTAESVETGAAHTCAVFSNLTVACWGDNVFGKLGNGTSVSSSTAVEPRWPELAAATSMPRVSGISSVGQTLTVVNGDWTGTPTPSFTYQWYACTTQVLSATKTIPGTCTTIDSATSDSLPLTSSIAGKYIAVSVTGTSGVTVSTTWLAPTSAKVTMKAAATVKPSLSGSAKVGKTLTVAKGTWTGSPAPTFTYKWYTCSKKVANATQTIPNSCRAIVGATKATFTLDSRHKGSFIAVAVTSTSAGTSASTWLSKSTIAKVS